MPRWTATRKQFVFSAASAAIATGLLLAWSVATKAPQHRQVETLKVAAPVIVSVGLHMVADAQGFWADEGLKIDFTPTVHGKAAMEMGIKKFVDLSWAADTPFVISAMRGEPINMLTAAGTGRNFTGVVARRDSGIKTPKDLIGRRVAIAENTTSDYFLWAFLIRNNIRPSEVSTVNVSPDKMAEQLANGQVDAISVWAPFREEAMDKLGQNAISMKAPDAYVLAQLILGNPEILHAKRFAIERYLRALARAEQFIKQHPEESMGIIAQRVGLPVDKVRLNWADFDYGLSITQSQLITLEANERWARQKGLVSKNRDANLLPFIELQPMLNVAPQAVTLLR